MAPWRSWRSCRVRGCCRGEDGHSCRVRSVVLCSVLFRNSIWGELEACRELEGAGVCRGQKSGGCVVGKQYGWVIFVTCDYRAFCQWRVSMLGKGGMKRAITCADEMGQKDRPPGGRNFISLVSVPHFISSNVGLCALTTYQGQDAMEASHVLWHHMFLAARTHTHTSAVRADDQAQASEYAARARMAELVSKVGEGGYARRVSKAGARAVRLVPGL
eukprot:429575-Pelagomonas_calceolata.AAC.2